MIKWYGATRNKNIKVEKTRARFDIKMEMFLGKKDFKKNTGELGRWSTIYL